MKTVEYWPLKNRPQRLSHLHKLDLDGVVLSQGQNILTEEQYKRMLRHGSLALLTACGAVVLPEAAAVEAPYEEFDQADYDVVRHAEPDALRLINGTDLASELEILPTIGRGAASVILENRPEGGYASMEQVWQMNQKILKYPYKTDIAAVEAWGDGE